MSDTMTVRWTGGMSFSATSKFGMEMRADASRQVGGEESAPSPGEYLYFAAAGCTGMDVISILNKMKQEVSSYSITVEVERHMGDYPRPITKLKVIHTLSGPNLDPEAVEKAVKLSDEKYCFVAASLRQPVEVSAEYRVE